jgi:hypothetical protein
LNPTAVERAKARLERAERALTEFKAATSYPIAEAAWTDFLLATSSIYSQFEQGVKGYPRSISWYGRQKNNRKNHPVLRYIHFARNSDEHGIEFVTERHPDGGFNFSYGERHEFTIYAHDPVTGEIESEGHAAWGYGPHLKLIRANDRRFHDFCDPPYGAVNPPGDPAAVGDAALQLLRTMVLESESFI